MPPVLFPKPGSGEFPPGAPQAFEIAQATRRTLIFEQVPHSDTGVLTKDIQHFATALDLEISPFIVADDARDPDTRQAFLRNGASAASRVFADRPGARGTYVPTANLAVIDRADRPDGVQLNRRVVHEAIGHAAGLYNFYFDNGEVGYTHKGGLIEPNPRTGEIDGAWLEEGRAAWVEAHFAATLDPALAEGSVELASGLTVPKRYATDVLTDTGARTGCNDSAIAALGLELLIDKNPAIADALIASYKANAGIDALRTEINKTTVGLDMFGSLASLPQGDRTAFYGGLSLVLQAAYNGDLSATAHAGEASNTFFAQKLTPAKRFTKVGRRLLRGLGVRPE